MTFTTRLARTEDAERIAAIHNQGIEERIATFETDPRDAESVARQLERKGDRFPTIVVEFDGRVVAWASVGSYRDRACYEGIGEHSVYVDNAVRGMGAGRLALDALCDACAECGFWKLVSRIFPENIASLRLHERCGFRTVGVYVKHARLDGRWRDCVIVERLLGSAAVDE